MHHPATSEVPQIAVAMTQRGIDVANSLDANSSVSQKQGAKNSNKHGIKTALRQSSKRRHRRWQSGSPVHPALPVSCLLGTE